MSYKLHTFEDKQHGVKSVQIQIFLWSEYRKIQIRNISVFGHFSRNAESCINTFNSNKKTL